MAEFRCVACLLNPDENAEVWSAVTLWDGSAYCFEHLKQRVAADLSEAEQYDGVDHG